MEILLVEPYYSGSHQQWADGFVRSSQFSVSLLTLPGRHWKWRMAGACIELARQYKELESKPKMILASDMLDVATFKAISGCSVPIGVYFHENQITYPNSEFDPDKTLMRDHHYGLKNITTVFASDFVFFNSNYHYHAFMDSIPGFVKQFPDFNKWPLDSLYKKSSVLPLGVDLQSLGKIKSVYKNEIPVVLWNHRWEHDKNPDQFFHLLKRLKDDGVSFELVLLGKRFNKTPPAFDQIIQTFSSIILHHGFVEDRSEYISWLKRSDFLPVTSHHDFFGVSVVEAIYSGVYPLLPKRLTYPEHIPSYLHKTMMYRTEDDLFLKLKKLLLHQGGYHISQDLLNHVFRYDWSNMAPVYDKCFGEIMNP